MAFPSNPIPGQEHVENGIKYVFRDNPPRWDLIGPVTTAGERYENTYSGNHWVIGHNLGQRYVAVQVVDAAGNTLIGDPDYTSTNVLTVDFSQPVSGTAVVRK